MLACSWCWSDVAVAPLIVNLMNLGRRCQINIILRVNASVSLFLLLHRAGRSFAAVQFDLPRKGAAMYHSQEPITRDWTGALVDPSALA